MSSKAIVAVVLVGLAAAPALAQSGRADRAFELRFGGFYPQGGGRFWNDTEDAFTLDVSDFDDFIFGMSYIGSFNNRLEIGVNLDFYEKRVFSSYRGFVDQDGFAINHDSTLSLVPLTVDFRFLPGGRYRGGRGGRGVLQPVFYLGGGGGVNFWKYEEVGDFLDFTIDPPEIFGDRFVDDGEALEAHVLAGVELPLSPRFNVVLEGRYSWSDDTLGGSLAGLGDIELGGLATYVGASFRF